VLRPAEATALRAATDYVEADILCDGKTMTLTAKWVVGCDGSRSVARIAAGVEFDGGTYPQDLLLADVHMAWPISRDEVTLFVSLEGFVMVAPLPGAPDRYRIVATADESPEALDTPRGGGDSSRYRYILSMTEGVSLPDGSIPSAAATMAGMIASTRSTTIGCIKWPL
jgi:2-polyprenyl-6-methoxyphenol hydroxylase-like FAD-dependent oxidoreductase